MNPLLLTMGLLLIATALTLLASGPRTWLVAVAQGIGVQAVIGGLASVVQVVWFTEESADWPVSQRIIETVQGIPYHAAGWTGRAIFEQTSAPGASALADPAGYFPIVAFQIAIVGLILGWRKMEDEKLTDPVQLLIWALLIGNTILNSQWAWGS